MKIQDFKVIYIFVQIIMRNIEKEENIWIIY